LNIYNVLIESNLLYFSETWRLTENTKRWVEATEMDGLRRSSRISRKVRIRNITIRQKIGLSSVSQTVVREPQVVLGFCPCGPFRMNISPKKTEKTELT